MENFTASAPGKVILFGEHFVVYGEPAIAVALDLRVEATAYRCGKTAVEGLRTPLVERAIEEALRFVNQSGEAVCVRLRSNLPVSVGLGSSAATAVAVIASITGLFGVKPSRDRLFRMALEVEKTVHVNPSGIDPAISVNGGAILYRRGRGIEPIKLGGDFTLVIGNTGVPRSTGAMVEKVRLFAEKHPRVMDRLRAAASSIASEALEALEKGDVEKLGRLMDVNHGLLEAIGVSSLELERLVYAARRAGALGAKLTGAGGGGCMVALVAGERVEAVVEAIRKAGGKPMVAPISRVGVLYGNG